MSCALYLQISSSRCPICFCALHIPISTMLLLHIEHALYIYNPSEDPTTPYRYSTTLIFRSSACMSSLTRHPRTLYIIHLPDNSNLLRLLHPSPCPNHFIWIRILCRLMSLHKQISMFLKQQIQILKRLIRRLGIYVDYVY